MGRLLDRLLSTSPAYEVRREAPGYILTGKPGHAEAFSQLVRQMAEEAGDDCVVFPISDGHHGYTQMFILPTDVSPRQ